MNWQKVFLNIHTWPLQGSKTLGMGKNTGKGSKTFPKDIHTQRRQTCFPVWLSFYLENAMLLQLQELDLAIHRSMNILPTKILGFYLDFSSLFTFFFFFPLFLFSLFLFSLFLFPFFFFPLFSPFFFVFPFFLFLFFCIYTLSPLFIPPLSLLPKMTSINPDGNPK